MPIWSSSRAKRPRPQNRSLDAALLDETAQSKGIDESFTGNRGRERTLTMKIYLLRHAQAEERDARKYPTDDRPLTDRGMERTRDACDGVIRVVKRVDAVLTSPLVRARKTAEIVAEALGVVKGLEVVQFLSPGCWPESVLSHLRSRAEGDRVMLVGHEPDLGLLASALCGASHAVVAFNKGSLCRIDVNGAPGLSRGAIVWHLTQRQLRRLS